MLNRRDRGSLTLTVTFAELGVVVSGPCKVRDLIAQRDLPDAIGSFSASVGACFVSFYAVFVSFHAVFVSFHAVFVSFCAVFVSFCAVFVLKHDRFARPTRGADGALELRRCVKLDSVMLQMTIHACIAFKCDQLYQFRPLITWYQFSGRMSFRGHIPQLKDDFALQLMIFAFKMTNFV